MFRLFFNSGFRSLRNKMIIWAFVFTLFVVILFFVITGFVTKSIQNETQANIQQIIKPYSKEIDIIMENARRYIATQEIDYSIFHSSNDELTDLQSMQNLGDNLENDLSIYSNIDAVFIFCQDEMIFVQNYGRSYVKSRSVADYLQGVLQLEDNNTNLFSRSYQHFRIDNDQYFYIAINSSDGIFGCWFSFDTLLSEINKAEIEGLQLATFSDAQNNILYAEDYESNKSAGAKDELIISEQLANSEISLIAMLDRGIALASSIQLARVQYVTIIIATILIIVYLWMMRKIIVLPLTRLSSAIDSINAGKTVPLEINEKEDIEIAEIYRALNSKIAQIEFLNNHIYEDNISRQKIQLQMYQLQIKPHFFLNVLNNILSLARSNEYQKVRDMILYLSKHIRYLLYNMRFVTLEEELEYTRNYINMQNIMRDCEYVYEESIEEDLLDNEIPILIIQIFVENSIKHSQAAITDLKITVSVKKLTMDEKNAIAITIEDNGGGFSEQVISDLNGEERGESPIGEGSIGIENVCKRLKLYYTGVAQITFSNSELGGARVEMKIPEERR